VHSGSFGLGLKTADGIRQLSNGGKVGSNDLVQLSYYSARQKYGAILSLDGQGSITQHLPEQGAQAAQLHLWLGFPRQGPWSEQCLQGLLPESYPGRLTFWSAAA